MGLMAFMWGVFFLNGWIIRGLVDQARKPVVEPPAPPRYTPAPHFVRRRR